MKQGALGRWLVIAACVAVAATLVVAMSRLGSPTAQRAMRLDEKRVHDLDHIVDVINKYAEKNHSLPPTLDTLARQPGRTLSIADPDGVPYIYQVTGDRTYRLCTVFATDTAKDPESGQAWTQEEWLHAAGRQCFDRKLNTKSEDE
ncbi:MAG: hypothetical protein LH470_08240 [Lysobacter sp.]|nr:hypothetical protein [Lysobacter sp.]